MSLTARRHLDAILFAHFEASKHLLGGSWESFTESMRETNALLPLALQTRIFSDVIDVPTRMEANGKRMRRYADERHDHRMPAELVLVFVRTLHGLAPAAGVLLLSELTRFFGSLYVPIPDPAAGVDMAHLSRVAKEFGEFCVAWAPIMADGKLDAADARYLDDAIAQSEDLVAAAVSAKEQLMALRSSLVGRA